MSRTYLNIFVITSAADMVIAKYIRKMPVLGPVQVGLTKRKV